MAKTSLQPMTQSYDSLLVKIIWCAASQCNIASA